MVQIYTALDLARIDIDGPLPVREKGQTPSTKNRSPRIDQLNALCGVAFGSPYCGAGVSECFYTARRFGADGPAFPLTASSQGIRRHFEQQGLLTFDPDDLLEMTAAVAGWTNEDDPGHGHVFFVEQRKTVQTARRLTVVEIVTLEYNTSPQTKGRDGQGGYRLERNVKDRKFWYCDCSKYAGAQHPKGGWWCKL